MHMHGSNPAALWLLITASLFAKQPSIRFMMSSEQLRESFHKYIAEEVARSFKRAAVATTMEYATDCTKCRKMLEANVAHRDKPSLQRLTNVVFIYKAPDRNLYDIVTCDPYIALWVGHIMEMYREQDLLVAYICFMSL